MVELCLCEMQLKHHSIAAFFVNAASKMHLQNVFFLVTLLYVHITLCNIFVPIINYQLSTCVNVLPSLFFFFLIEYNILMTNYQLLVTFFGHLNF